MTKPEQTSASTDMVDVSRSDYVMSHFGQQLLQQCFDLSPESIEGTSVTYAELEDFSRRLIAGVYRRINGQPFPEIPAAGVVAKEPTWGSAQAFLPEGDPALLVVRGGTEATVIDADDPDGNGMGLSDYIEKNRRTKQE